MLDRDQQRGRCHLDDLISAAAFLSQLFTVMSGAGAHCRVAGGKDFEKMTQIAQLRCTPVVRRHIEFYRCLISVHGIPTAPTVVLAGTLDVALVPAAQYTSISFTYYY